MQNDRLDRIEKCLEQLTELVRQLAITHSEHEKTLYGLEYNASVNSRLEERLKRLEAWRKS